MGPDWQIRCVCCQLVGTQGGQWLLAMEFSGLTSTHAAGGSRTTGTRKRGLQSGSEDNVLQRTCYIERLQHKQPLEKLWQLQWRLRSASLLNENRVKEILKNLKTWAQKFEMEDNMRKMTASKDLLKNRRKLLEDCRQYKEEKEREFAKLKEACLELRLGVDTDELHNQEDNFADESMEFLVKVEEKVVEE